MIMMIDDGGKRSQWCSIFIYSHPFQIFRALSQHIYPKRRQQKYTRDLVVVFS